MFESIVLGLVQGLTEFIPVSSSGHLVLTQALFGHDPDHLLIQTLDIGTVLALIIYFRGRLWELGRQVLIKRNYRLLRNIIITVLPAGLIGFLLANVIENSTLLELPLTVAIGLITVGVVMIILERLPKKSAVEDGEKLSAPRALTIGLAQALALIPGVSRSGSTIVAGRLMGLNAQKAAEYSFLVSIPIMLALVAKLFLSDGAYLASNIGTVVVGNIAAFVSGLVAVGFLMRFLGRHGLSGFGWYRVALGTLVVLLVLTGVLQ